MHLTLTPNSALNERELLEGHERLSSSPRHITLGTHNACNARCTFCLEGRYQRFDLELYKEFFEAKLGRYLDAAETVTFTGFGEVLWVPGIETFLDHINRALPHVKKVWTTNGTPLKDPVFPRLLETDHVVQVSLHAVDAATHEKLTELKGEFEAVKANVRRLVAAREEKKARLGAKDGFVHPFAKLISVLNTDNIDTLPEFVEQAWELGVQQVRCFHMTMFKEEHFALSCFFDPERANRAIRKARAVAERLHAVKRRTFDVDLPPLFGEPRAAWAPARCADPWQYMYVELQGSVQPCCSWGEHIADLKGPVPVEAVWNGDTYRALRRGMAAGEPLPWCRTCVRWTSYNVDDVRCHLTNRPDTQRRLLDELRRRGLWREALGS